MEKEHKTHVIETLELLRFPRLFLRNLKTVPAGPVFDSTEILDYVLKLFLKSEPSRSGTPTPTKRLMQEKFLQERDMHWGFVL